MKIAISSAGPSPDDSVDPRFGRCQYFIIADTETGDSETVDNANAMAGGGAGIATAQMIASKGVEAVLTGNCGPNAYETLSAAGIQVVIGVSGTVSEAIDGFKSGKYQATPQHNVESHFGIRGGGGGERSRTGPSAPATDTELELRRLRDLTQTLTAQVGSLQQRIQGLEEKK
jgi:predicted Fe-Mo cluster-binding NifX family protein